MSNNVTLPGTGVVVDTIDTSTNGTTNGTTAAGAAILNFAATPANVSAGMVVTDTIAPTVIPANTTVLSFTPTTVTMSANATGAGVGNGDTIHFAGGERQRVAIAAGDGSNVDPIGVPSGAAVTTDVAGTLQQYLRGLVKLIAAGINVAITNANANGRAVPTSSAPVVLNSMTYKAVAASATATLLGATGASGDYLDGVLIVPATAAAGAVSITDGAGSAITIFAGGGTTPLPTLAPFYVPIGAISSGGVGGWKVTTGTNVSVIGVGNFT